MRQGSSNYRSTSLNTDECGFRVCIANGHHISLGEFHDVKNIKKGIVIGNSSIFGVGTSSDHGTVSNRLNATDTNGILWYNLGLRASNMTQERIASELYAPKEIEYFAWISGGNDMVAMHLGLGGNRYSPPFIGEPAYLKTMNGVSEISQELGRDIEKKYHLLLGAVEREIELVSLYRRSLGARVLFCMQPMLSWVDKVLSVEETQLVGYFDSVQNNIHRVHAQNIMRPWYDRYTKAIENICRRCAVDYLDFNTHPGFRGPDWMFIDRIHVTDRAHAIMAETVNEWSNKMNYSHFTK